MTIAGVIAFPIAWYEIYQWLVDLAYRIAIPWWIFIVASIIAACIAILTISFQAALNNPVKNL
jgi:putative ABC transport system permease protein